MSANYTPYVNSNALESLFLRWGDEALANENGSSASVSGSDSAASVNTATNNPPERLYSNFATDIESILDWFSPAGTSQMKAAGIERPAIGSWLNPSDTTGTKGIASFFSQNLLWSVVLVVLALFMFSRGLGMIGEEAAGTVIQLDNPAKYPGIGHAIQRIKKRKQT